MVETENTGTNFLEVFIMKQKIQLSIQGNLLTVSPSSAPAATFDFPAAAISVRGERFEAKTPVAPPEKLKSGIWKAVYADGPFTFTVTVTPGKGDWFFKEVEVVSDTTLPTPDYLEVDRQKHPAPGMRSCGYRSTRVDLDHITSEEEGSGVVPGCGYPLVSEKMFTGLEHPASQMQSIITCPAVTGGSCCRGCSGGFGG